jgi:transposase
MTISTDVDKLYDTDLSDASWALIAPMLPAARPGGRQRKINIRAVLNAIFIYCEQAANGVCFPETRRSRG